MTAYDIPLSKLAAGWRGGVDGPRPNALLVVLDADTRAVIETEPVHVTVDGEVISQRDARQLRLF